MSNSSLVSYTRLSPNHSGKRNHAIDTITIHHMAGNLSVEACGNLFADPSRRGSSNYGIGSDGRIALYVDEANRAWTSSNGANDNRAVTIEVANNSAEPDWSVSPKAFAALIDLVTDICRRNGIARLVWSASKNDRVNHQGGCNMTVHRDFAATACPGPYLMEKMYEIAAKVNKRLDDTNDETIDANYMAVVTAKGGLHCRTAPISGDIVTTYPKGSVILIVKERSGWGYTGTGWVSLAYITKTENEEDDDMDVNRFSELWNEMRKGLQDNDCGSYSEQARQWATSSGLVVGGDPINGEPNYMWQDLMTREQLVTVLYRFAQMMGKA